MNRSTRAQKRDSAELRKAYSRARARRVGVAQRNERFVAVLAAHARAERDAAAFQSSELLSVIALRAPRLIEPALLPALHLAASLPHLRAPGEWEPRGKGTTTRVRSLFAHLFARFPMPSVLWGGFFDADSAVLAPLVVWVASGGSLYEIAKARLTIPLTRKACHLALASDERSLLRALRLAQALAVGGDLSLANAWAGTAQAARIGRAKPEAFFSLLIAWLAARPHRTEDVGPMIDYVAARYAEDDSFSMKGRTVEALLRDTRAWHREIGRARAVQNLILPSSGLRGTTVEVREPKPLVWRVREVTTTQELFDEGRRMGHCVYTYAPAIQSRATSIWCMTKTDGEGPTGTWAMLTIEVRNAERAIVQARGRFNRAPTDEETRVLARFAATNGLAIRV